MHAARTLAGILAGLSLVAGAPAGFADEVHLRDGGSLTGRVIDGGGETIEVIHEIGSVVVARDEVAWIDRGPTARDEFRARLADVDPDDPIALEELAIWAAANGLFDKSREVRAMARDRALERRLAEILPGDARAYLELARWARVEGLDRRIRRELLGRALRAEPANDEAKRELDALDAEEKAEREAALLRAERAKLRAEIEKLEAERRALEAERRRAERAERRAREAEARAREAAWEAETRVWPVMYGGSGSSGSYGAACSYGGYYFYGGISPHYYYRHVCRTVVRRVPTLGLTFRRCR